MGHYRKKPVVIEARQFTEADAESLTLAHWCGGVLDAGQILIETLEGRMAARPGDWIIKGVQDEFYPCRDDIFSQTYEAVD